MAPLRFATGLHLTLVLSFLHLTTSSFAPVFYGLKLPSGNTSVNHISTLTTILQVPSLPVSQGIVIWPGMGTEENYLVQSIIANGAGALKHNCHAPTTNAWCAFSYVYHGPTNPPGLAKSYPNARGTLVKPNDLINITYVYNPSTDHTTQTMTLVSSRPHKVLSHLSAKTGPGWGFHDRVECHVGSRTGVATPGHVYWNTTLVLEKPEMGVAANVRSESVEMERMVTDDGGQTWRVPRIMVAGSECPS